MKTAILGCGWLGLPLARKLAVSGVPVNGSTTSQDKMEILRSSGIQPFLLRLRENGIEGPVAQFLLETETLIVDIPPKLRGRETENFVGKIGQLVSVLKNSTVKNLLFISSTSVYRDDNTVVTEKTTPLPNTESGRQLLAAEVLLQSATHFNTTVLRFGGLIGPGRHPVHHLAGKTGLKNPENPVNLIQQDDCIHIITEIIRQQKWGKVYNAAYPSHPSRRVYYTEKADKLGLEPPQFVPSPAKGKIISSDTLVKDLGYIFRTSI